MKIMQSLGKSGNVDEGVFSYRRDQDGILIVPLERTDTTEQADPYRLTFDEWKALVDEFYEEDSSIKLSDAREVCADAVENPNGGWNWTDSHAAHVVAVLEHEGTVDLAQGRNVAIRVIRDDTNP